MRYNAKSEASRDLGRRQFFEVLTARITIQWPRSLRSGRIELRHSRGTHLSTDGRPTQPGRLSAGLEASGLPSGGHLAPAPYLATHVPWPRSQEPSRPSPRSWTSWRVSSVEQRMSPRSVTKPWRCPCRTEMETCIASGAFARRKATSDGERRTRAHHQGVSARDDAEKISGRRPCSMAESLGRQGQGPTKGETLGQGEKTPASQGPVQRKVQRRGQSFRGESLSSTGAPLRRSRISTRW